MSPVGKQMRKFLRFKTIKGGQIDNLMINLDYDVTPKRLYPVILFTPDMKDTNTHYHIRLNKKQARELRDWLNKFVQEGK
jgi:hypothetical protein